MTPIRDSPISSGDVAALSIGSGAQPYVITVAGLLAPGGFVDARGGADLEALRQHLVHRLGGCPELLQRAVPRDGQWWWVTESPDLAHHVVSIPAGESFGSTCGQLVMAPLDADRPLWQLTVVPSAQPERCGLVFRIHHMLVDGARATLMLERLFSTEPVDHHEAPVQVPDEPCSPTVRPSLRQRTSFRLRTFVHPRIGSATLLGVLSEQRDTAVASVGLPALQSGADACGGTINDAYLVAVGQGMRHVLDTQGEAAPASIAMSVPVSVRGDSSSRNAVGFMIVNVPLDPTKIMHNVADVAHQTARAKPLARDAGATFKSRRIARLFNWVGRRQHMIGAVATNVRGPLQQLSVAGAPLVELWPLAPLAGNLRMGFTAVSYDDRLWVGVEVDSATIGRAGPVGQRIADVLELIARSAPHE